MCYIHFDICCTCILVPKFFTTLSGKKVLYSEDKQSRLVKAKPTGAEEDSSEASSLTVLCGRHLNTEARYNPVNKYTQTYEAIKAKMTHAATRSTRLNRDILNNKLYKIQTVQSITLNLNS